MVGLLDIAPLTENVPIGDAQLSVGGISASGIVSLIQRFPDLRALMAERGVDAGSLLALGGDIVAAIIAAGCGSPGDAEYEAKAASLPLQAQADILAAIIKVTVGPNGIGPFFERLTTMLNVKGAAEALAKGPATKSPK